MVEMGGSDLHITTNSPPQVRVARPLVPLDLPPLTPAETKQLAYSVMTDAQKHRFEENLELDFSFGVKGLARFRANVFNQRGATAAVFRVDSLRDQVASTSWACPPVVEQALRQAARSGAGHRADRVGQVHHAGRHDRQDQQRAARAHHHHRGSDRIRAHAQEVRGQSARVARRHARASPTRLRAALRQDPDVVLIGEMRDLETIESALRIAETGHLTFGTLHTNSAASTINRIIDVFPAHQQPQIRAQLSLVLEGIMCQSLLPKADGKGRAMAMEILVPNAAIRNLIREDKIHQIYSSDAVRAGKVRDADVQPVAGHRCISKSRSRWRPRWRGPVTRTSCRK